MQDDIERLIEIAAQLFSAIERQIHLMEEELVIASGEQVRTYAQTVFKERLISCAESLDTSLKEITFNLEQRASGQASLGLLRAPNRLSPPRASSLVNSSPHKDSESGVMRQ